jgi:hypothetical protein
MEADAVAAARGCGDDVGAAAEEGEAGADINEPASGDEGEEEGKGEEGGAGGGAWVAGVLAEAAARGTQAEGMRAELEGFVEALHARVGEEGEALVEFPANFPEILAAAEYAPPPPRKCGARGCAARGAQPATALCKRRDALT